MKRRTKPPRSLPSGATHTVSIRASFFLAEDVLGLPGEGLPSPQKRPASVVAILIHNAFAEAVTFAPVAVAGATRGEVLDFLRQVRLESSRLAATLEAAPCAANAPDPETESAEEPGVSRKAWFQHVTDGLHDLPPATMNDVRSLMANNLRDTIPVLELLDSETPAEYLTRRDYATARTLLQLVPAILCLLGAAAGNAIRTTETRDARSGPRPDEFRRILFRGLAKAHHAMFGIWPKYSDNTGERGGGPSVPWAQTVIDVAAKRAKSVLTKPDSLATDPIRELADASDRVIGDGLAEGTKSAKGRRSP